VVLDRLRQREREIADLRTDVGHAGKIEQCRRRSSSTATPGHDDAIALLLALASPELELLGVTTTYGNQTLEKTTANALRVLELVGRTAKFFDLLVERIASLDSASGGAEAPR
jgi:hypothetical protein